MKHQSGYTLIELLIVTAIISILAATAIPQFYPFKTRAYDADAKSNLHNVFLSCKGYWALNSSNNSCVLNTVSNNEYGFVQSAAVEVTMTGNNNTEYNFNASASHLWSSNVYVIDYRGVISSVNAGNGGGNNGGNNGNAGGGGGNNGGNNGNAGGGGGNNGGNNGNAGGGGGNNGQGCSEEAQNDPQNLGQNAAGGCA